MEIGPNENSTPSFWPQRVAGRREEGGASLAGLTNPSRAGFRRIRQDAGIAARFVKARTFTRRGTDALRLELALTGCLLCSHGSDLLKAGWLPPVQRAEPTVSCGKQTQSRRKPDTEAEALGKRDLDLIPRPQPASLVHGFCRPQCERGDGAKTAAAAAAAAVATRRTGSSRQSRWSEATSRNSLLNQTAAEPLSLSTQQLRCLTVREWPSSSASTWTQAAQADGRCAAAPQLFSASVDPGRSRNALGGSADWITMPLAAAANALALPLTALLLRLAVLLNLLLWQPPQALYFLLPLSLPDLLPQQPEACANFTGGAGFQSGFFTFTTPNYPARYPARSDCIKLIRAEYPHQVVKLDFRDEFFIEDNSQCATRGHTATHRRFPASCAVEFAAGAGRARRPPLVFKLVSTGRLPVARFRFRRTISIEHADEGCVQL
uniref:CUB domain-containing protein n=1 Tax=Macrostomum lignano TaxID=282301 RepID=A0A1I8F6H3_9PLAT